MCVCTHAPEHRPVLLTLPPSFPLLLPDPTGRRWWRERKGSLSHTYTNAHAWESLSAWALLLHPPCPSPGGPGPAFVCASGWQPPCIFNANLLSVLTNRLARRGVGVVWVWQRWKIKQTWWAVLLSSCTKRVTVERGYKRSWHRCDRAYIQVHLKKLEYGEKVHFYL